MKKAIRILMVEDNDADASLVRHALKKDGLSFTMERVETAEEYRHALENEPPDVILSDYALPSFDGYMALAIARERQPYVPFIFVTGTMGEEVAIETLKNGATDYVLKVRLSRLAPAVRRAMREAAERAERKRAEEQLRRSHEQLHALSMYLQHVREEERIRISRAVHDELGQALTGLKIDLSWLGSRLPKKLRPLIHKTKKMSVHIDETIKTVRRISTELRPGILDHLGLAAAVEWQANEFQTRTGIPCKVENGLKHTILEEELNTVCFRIFQESLTNIIRHAKATCVEVSLAEDRNRLTLDVKDNGQGITPDQIASIRSIGLLGMHERAALLGGKVQIRGVPGHGTHVTLTIPLENPVRSKKRDNENPHSRRSRSSAAWPEANSRG